MKAIIQRYVSYNLLNLSVSSELCSLGKNKGKLFSFSFIEVEKMENAPLPLDFVALRSDKVQ